MRTRSLFFLIFTVLIVMSLGCGNNVKIRGKVTFSDDQSPLTVGQVTFRNDTILARGTLKPDGTYVLGTLKEKDGIPKGTYNVTIADAHELILQESQNKKSLPTPVMRQLIVPPKDLTFVVDGKQKVFNIEVERAK